MFFILILFSALNYCSEQQNSLVELTTKKITLINSRKQPYLYQDENLIIKKNFNDYAATFAAAHAGIALCTVSTKLAGLFALGIGLYEIYQDYWHGDKTLVYKRTWLKHFYIFVKDSLNEWHKKAIHYTLNINDKRDVLLLYDNKGKPQFLSNIPQPCRDGGVCHVANCSAYCWDLFSCTDQKNICFYDSVHVNVFDNLKKFYLKEYPQHQLSFIILEKNDQTYHFFLHENYHPRLSAKNSFENVIHVSLAQDFPAYAVEYLKKTNLKQETDIGPSVIDTSRNIDVIYREMRRCTLENAHLIDISRDGTQICYLQNNCMKIAKISWDKNIQQSIANVSESIPFKSHNLQILINALKKHINSQEMKPLNIKGNFLDENIRREYINEKFKDLQTKLLLRMPVSKVYIPKPYTANDN